MALTGVDQHSVGSIGCMAWIDSASCCERRRQSKEDRRLIAVMARSWNTWLAPCHARRRSFENLPRCSTPTVPRRDLDMVDVLSAP